MEQNNRVMFSMVLAIAVLSVFAAGTGVVTQGTGQPYDFQTIRGETVSIQGHGLYELDTVSLAAQAIA